MKTMSILLATDGSPEALAAAEWLDRWNVPERTEVTVVTVITPPSTAWAGAGGYVLDAGIYEKTYQEILDEEKSEGHEILAKTAKEIIHCRVVREEVLMGQPARAIVEYAKTHHIDLIIMGRRGHSALGNLMGSVSFGVLQRSSVPVTIVS
ncbi:universal stress protein [Sulfobacillus harzensis]|uniref:Universal stress protein n=1 Tax=Sulfobacillus harzensis TaxID=2729629 RepID=A0A7Y0Q3R8_9FIRM|nr:universal stress protein [Sulfobacillus harzensis]NMP24558.1 universal stress protein [Sulfobacillus harzensis]